MTWSAAGGDRDADLAREGVAADLGALSWGREPRCYLMSTRMPTRQTVRSPTTHGAANTAAHQHGDWLHRSRNLGVASGFCNHPVHGQSELLVDPLIRRRFTESCDAHDHTIVFRDPAVPGLRRGCFDGNPRHTGWEHGVPIVL